MQNGKNIKNYTAAELKVKGTESQTDLKKIDAMTDEDLEQIIAEEERDLKIDWTKATLVMPQRKQSVHLRLEKEVIDFFKSQGKGHLVRMQAVLKAYVEAHKR